mmetsp:Transcript_19859/g.25575  ORF Transcript_19859/g.25575 Transcript_19859/m.25575 type:complete len:408 (+) Transcript_19859:60-1283(+)
MVPLPLNDVRRLALECNLKEIQFNETSRVLAFRSKGNGGKFGRSSTRFNVYYTTGTVGTYLEHPRQGKTQLFRRNVSLTMLEDIFQSPRLHTDFGYHLRQSDPYLPSTQRKQKVSGVDSGDDAESMDEEKAAKKQMAKLLAEKQALENEVKEVQGILDDHEQRREKERQRVKDEQIRLEEIARNKRQQQMAINQAEIRHERGRYGSWSGLDSTFKRNFTEYTSCVAIGDGGIHICLYNQGSWSYSSEIPDGLYNLLHTRALSHPTPTYVALGSMNRYYVKFANGKSQWEGGPQEMTDLLQNTKRIVKSVAFGQDNEDYFVVFVDGWFQYNGCPQDLHDKIEARRSSSDIDKVTLGPNGEWSLWAKNGRMWWGNFSDALWTAIDSLPDNRIITDVLFGDADAYFVRYT